MSNFYDVMPPPEEIKEMKDARFKGAVYQRREKKSPSKQYKLEDETIAESYSETYDENCNIRDGTAMCSPYNDDIPKGLLPCDLFSEEDEYGNEDRYNSEHDISDEDSIMSNKDVDEES